MRLRSFLAELRRRGVLKVATAYLATGWVVLEGAGFLFQSFGAPPWALKALITVVLLGFPFACLMAWGFEFTEDGVRPAVPLNAGQSAPARGSDLVLGALLALVLVLVGTSLVRDWRGAAPFAAKDAAPSTSASAGSPVTATPAPIETVAPDSPDDRGPQAPGARTPIVVIMDTPAPRGVYEAETRERSGTNADDLNELLRDLPVSIHKETVGATWDREQQVLQQAPDLVLVHRSAFFHAMNFEFGFGYPGDASGFDVTRASRLYELADIKLVSVLGFLGSGNPGTKFIVYSRGSGPDSFEEEEGRSAWLRKVEGRFPFLKGRVTPLLVPGGTSGGSFDDPETARILRDEVEALLGLSLGGAS
jgi:hypothetical protein